MITGGSRCAWTPPVPADLVLVSANTGVVTSPLAITATDNRWHNNLRMTDISLLSVGEDRRIVCGTRVVAMIVNVW